ncbi:MAG TPA: DUF58 domain-containing protein, partial [Cyclobacteriaceae bacterium]|nr:DUF58 domain-containing protein [Cyclobacteriaceae bacterium]
MKKVEKLDFKEIKKFDNLELLARQLVEGFITGLHKSPYHGFSVEFAEHRLYNEGESTRHVDWKVYARTDKLFTKQYEEETNLRCQIVIDNSASMHYPVPGKDKLKFSVFCAAAIAYLLQKQRDAVGITIFSDRVNYASQVKATASHLNKLLQTLQQLIEEEPSGKATDVAAVIHEIAETNHRRSLIIIFSDMFENSGNQTELFKALQHLKHNKHEVLLFHVAEYESEFAFEFEDRPHRFIDLESGDKIELNPGQI